MTHPSIIKARELLANRDAQELEHEIWRAQHRNEIEAIEADLLITRRAKATTVLHRTYVDEGHQGKEFIFSTETIDRYGDVIVQKGWELKSYWKNNVALFNHQPDFAIGVFDGVGVVDNKLRGFLRLAPLGTSPRVDEIIRLVGANVLKSVSVGFVPLQSEPMPNGIGRRFLRAELVEVSLTSCPANPEALAVAKSLRVSDETMAMVFTPQATTPIEALADMIGEETGKAANDIRALQNEIKSLRGELAGLRAENLLRGR